MAPTSDITLEGLKGKIVESLEATHVDVEDMSGMRIPCLDCPTTDDKMIWG